jgi:hypothetical protein
MSAVSSPSVVQARILNTWENWRTQPARSALDTWRVNTRGEFARAGQAFWKCVGLKGLKGIHIIKGLKGLDLKIGNNMLMVI